MGDQLSFASLDFASKKGAEVKLTMTKGQKVQLDWPVAGGVVNFDLHGGSF
ncbi:hypothetical protein ACO2I3_21685 [Leptospira interrogans]